MVLSIWELRKGLKHPDLDKAYGKDSSLFLDFKLRLCL